MGPLRPQQATVRFFFLLLKMILFTDQKMCNHLPCVPLTVSQVLICAKSYPACLLEMSLVPSSSLCLRVHTQPRSMPAHIKTAHSFSRNGLITPKLNSKLQPCLLSSIIIFISELFLCKNGSGKLHNIKKGLQDLF